MLCGSLGGPYASGNTRAGRRSMALRQVLVAIRYSQARRELRASNLARPRQARRNASCSASSASCTDPSMR